MCENWVGKVAIVTGASSGIGAAILSEFARHKIKVVGLARRLEKIEAEIESSGDLSENVFALKCNVSDPKSVSEAFKWIENKFGVVHILVNNAGVCKNLNILDEGDEAFKELNQVIDVNVRGLVQCTREAFRLMKKSNDYGLIININSIAGHSIPFMTFPMNLYAPTKHAVTAISEVIRQELVIAGNKKIRITSVSPGAVDTEIAQAGGYKDEGKFLDKERLKLQARDVAQCVMFVLSTPFTVNILEITVKPVGERV